jgi:hypothetical protein
MLTFSGGILANRMLLTTADVMTKSSAWLAALKRNDRERPYTVT